MRADDATDALAALARAAGRTIMAVRAEGFEVERKGDESPVTRADRAAETVILEGLCALIARGTLPDVPIVAEEAVSANGVPELATRDLILVDPLDGTKEFARGGEDFTVNIALVKGGAPVLGVVFQPALDALFTGGPGGAFVVRGGRRARMCARALEPGERLRIVASRSHRTAETDAWIGRVERAFGAGAGTSDVVSCGSSLKFCRLAEGRAHLYPCIGRTMEWDTAAGDAVLRAAGGMTYSADGEPMIYGRSAGSAGTGRRVPDRAFANPPFIASARAFDALPEAMRG